MAPKKSYRSVKVINKDYSTLQLNDVLCPICRNILIEPVSLPCSHGFCFACFEGTVANANLTCPLCRVRFGSWHRVACKENKIINEPLWTAIKRSFSQQVQNRLKGIEDDFTEVVPIRLSTPGDIRKEYEEQKKRELLEEEKQRALEAKASEELINKIKEQEKLEWVKMEETLRKDEEVARRLAEEINQPQKVVTPRKSKPLDKYLIGKIQKQSTIVPDVKKKEKAKETVINLEQKEYVSKMLCQNKNEEKPVKNGAIKKIQNDDKGIPLTLCLFQPIEVYKSSDKYVPPIKVPAKYKKTTINIIPPKGTVNFTHNTNSPFVSVQTIEKPNNEVRTRKRKCNEINNTAKEPNQTMNGARKSLKCDEKSANMRKSDRLNKQNKPLNVSQETEESDVKSSKRRRDSSPFCDFERTTRPTSPTDVIEASNNIKDGGETLQKILQEKKDLELAKMLQEQFNKERYSTRSSIKSGDDRCKRKRQIKITNIIQCKRR